MPRSLALGEGPGGGHPSRQKSFGTTSIKMGSVEFLRYDDNSDPLTRLCEDMKDQFGLDPLDLMPVFPCLQFLAESPF